MKDRNTAIIITAVTAVLCGIPGLCLILWGSLAVLGGALETSGPDSAGPIWIGVLTLSAGLLLALTPAAVGFFTLRKRGRPRPPAADPDEPLPPAI